jgi:hypothetical protein
VLITAPLAVDSMNYLFQILTDAKVASVRNSLSVHMDNLETFFKESNHSYVASCYFKSIQQSDKHHESLESGTASLQIKG